MTRQKIVLRYAEALVCELIDVVRNHHDSMPGPSRDRPGVDRVHLRAPGGEVLTVDLWSGSGQDVARAPRYIELTEGSEMLCWRAAEAPKAAASAPAGETKARVMELPVYDADPAPRAKPALAPAVTDVATSSLPGGDRGPTKS